MNIISSLLIYIGVGLISISILVLFWPKVKNIFKKIKKIKKKASIVKSSNKELLNLDCEEPNGVKINICSDSALTKEDEVLRQKLFEKHIKHYNPEGNPLFDGKIPIPFEALVFLTKNHAPIVNEDGEIIVSLNKTDLGLVVSNKKDVENIPISKIKEEDEGFFDDIQEPSSDIDIINKVEDKIRLEVEEEIKKEGKVKKNTEKEELKEVDKEKLKSTVNDGFLTGNPPEKEEESFLKEVKEEALDDILKQALEESNELDIETDYIPDEEEDDDDLFGDEEFDSNDIEEVEVKMDISFKLPSSQKEAQLMFDKEFIISSLGLLGNGCIIGSTVDLDDAMDYLDDNTEKCQEVFVKNLFAINGVGVTNPDKIVIFSKYSIAKALSLTFTQLEGVSAAIFKHLISTKGIKDILNMLRFITSNPEFIISNPNKPFDFLVFETEDLDVCKDSVIQISATFIEEIFGSLGSVVMKYPPRVVKVVNKEAKVFCKYN